MKWFVFFVIFIGFAARAEATISETCREASGRVALLLSSAYSEKLQLSKIQATLLTGSNTKVSVEEVSKKYAERKKEILNRIKEILDESSFEVIRDNRFEGEDAVVQGWRLARITSISLISRYVRQASMAPFMLERPSENLASQLTFLINNESSTEIETDTPLRREFRFRYEQMARGEMNWPENTQLREFFGLNSSLPQVRSFEPDQVEAYLDYQEIWALEQILVFLELKLLLEARLG